MNIARFFGDGKHGVHGVLEAYRHGGQAFWYFASNCVSYCATKDLPGAMWFDPDTLDPLINNPGHVKGMENYAEAVKLGPPGMINFDSNEVRQRFANGEAVLCIDWDDTPIIGELQKNSKVKGKIGSQLLPGSTRGLRPQEGRLGQAAAAEPARVAGVRRLGRRGPQDCDQRQHVVRLLVVPGRARVLHEDGHPRPTAG